MLVGRGDERPLRSGTLCISSEQKHVIVGRATRRAWYWPGGATARRSQMGRIQRGPEGCGAPQRRRRAKRTTDPKQGLRKAQQRRRSIGRAGFPSRPTSRRTTASNGPSVRSLPSSVRRHVRGSRLRSRSRPRQVEVQAIAPEIERADGAPSRRKCPERGFFFFPAASRQARSGAVKDCVDACAARLDRASADDRVRILRADLRDIPLA